MSEEAWVCLGIGIAVAAIIHNPAGLAVGALIYGLAQVLL